MLIIMSDVRQGMKLAWYERTGMGFTLKKVQLSMLSIPRLTCTIWTMKTTWKNSTINSRWIHRHRGILCWMTEIYTSIIISIQSSLSDEVFFIDFMQGLISPVYPIPATIPPNSRQSSWCNWNQFDTTTCESQFTRLQNVKIAQRIPRSVYVLYSQPNSPPAFMLPQSISWRWLSLSKLMTCEICKMHPTL